MIFWRKKTPAFNAVPKFSIIHQNLDRMNLLISPNLKSQELAIMQIRTDILSSDFDGTKIWLGTVARR